VPRKRPQLSEFELIKRFFTHPARSAVLGVGDDAALVRVRPGHELAISADMLVEGRHFFMRADPERLGYKCLAVNLSDMAAMGAMPRWATLALALPRVDSAWLAGFARGFMSLARSFRVDLVGGDTTRGPLAICVQIMGEVPAGKALRRDGARSGDDIWVSGELGDAAMALAATAGEFRASARERRAFEQRLHAPVPRVALGLALRGIVHSAIDISDGLLADLGHICERSRVGAIIQWESIPANPLVRARAQTDRGAQALLAGGDDYELCFTAPPSRAEEIERALGGTGTSVTRVGQLVPGQEVVCRRDGEPYKPKSRGYRHF